MRIQSVTAIAVAIIILASAVSGLVWILQGERLAPAHLISGAGVGCVFAALWVLFAALYSMFAKTRG